MQTPCPQHILWGDCIRKSDHILHRLSFLASRGCTVCRPRSQVWGMATCHPRHSRLPSGIPHKLCLGLQDWVHRLCECPESKGTRQKDGLVGSMCKQIVGSEVWIQDWHCLYLPSYQKAPEGPHTILEDSQAQRAGHSLIPATHRFWDMMMVCRDTPKC